VRLIHVKDLDENGKVVPFGTGRCPIAEFLRAVAESSYRGRIVLEVEMKVPLPQLVTILTDARQKSQEWLGAAVG
jgi:sugar phosphate isomerase/epimerase